MKWNQPKIGGYKKLDGIKECGGYIELEVNHGKMLHEEALALNCGRGALEYLCKSKNQEIISSIFSLFFCIKSM